ncbi:MAG: beta-galactosidase [Anaerolineae bacterium]|nr:beta-galactosidase [Anaerolineae bacterium]
MYYGADYYPEHWPEQRWTVDAGMMKAAGMNVVRVGEFAWTRMEPREGEFEFAWLDRALGCLIEEGISTILCTPTATPPAWLMRAYPECFLVDDHAQRLTFGHRRNTCPSSITYREYSARIVKAMSEHYAGNPNVIGWQIDNEFGDRCYCESCQRAFQSWLRAKYGTLKNLNVEWGTDFWSHVYGAWQEIPLPWATSYTHNPALALDYRRFISDTYVGYQQQQISILREADPDWFITHNFMGFRYPTLNYFDLAQDVDFVAWDNYPRYRTRPDLAERALSHDTMRGLKRANFWVMEEQSGPAGQTMVGSSPRPGEIPFWAWQAIAHGADGMVYFRWRTCRFGAEEYWHGILDHHGEPRRRYREVAGMGQSLKRIGELITGSRHQAQAAMVLSYDSRFALQNQPVNPDLAYEEIFALYYRAMWKLNIGVDIVRPGADISTYDLVIAPTLYILPEESAASLRDYVMSGGTLVTTCRSGVMNENNVVVNGLLPGLLAEVCGVVVDEYDSRDPGDLVPLKAGAELGGLACDAGVWADVLELRGADVLAAYGGDYYAGCPAVTMNHAGDGRAVYVGTVPDQAFADMLVGWLCELLGISAPLQAPCGVEVVVRASDDGDLVFLLNGTQSDKSVEVPAGCLDLISGELVEGEVSVSALGVRVLRI